MSSLSTVNIGGNRQGDLFQVPQAPKQSGTGGAGVLFESTQGRRETAQQVTRLAARANASAATDKERADLLAERTKLLDKKFDGTLTKSENIRLEYVRWSLDRIEEARHGPALDKLESKIEEIQRLAARLAGLRDGLRSASRRG